MALAVGKMKIKIRDDSWASRAWLVSSKKKKKKGRVDWWWSPTRICFSPYMIEGKPKICQKLVHVSREHLCCLSQNPSLLGEASSWQKHFSPLILKSSLIIILSNIASMGCVVFRALKLKVPRFCLSAFYNFLSLFVAIVQEWNQYCVWRVLSTCIMNYNDELKMNMMMTAFRMGMWSNLDVPMYLSSVVLF